MTLALFLVNALATLAAAVFVLDDGGHYSALALGFAAGFSAGLALAVTLAHRT